MDESSLDPSFSTLVSLLEDSYFEFSSMTGLESCFIFKKKGVQNRGQTKTEKKTKNLM